MALQGVGPSIQQLPSPVRGRDPLLLAGPTVGQLLLLLLRPNDPIDRRNGNPELLCDRLSRVLVTLLKRLNSSELNATDKTLRWFRWDRTTQVSLSLSDLSQ